MKIQFFDVEDLKSKPLCFWTSLLRTEGRCIGNLYFVANGSKFRVSFDFFGGVYSAHFFSFRSRIPFNVKYAFPLSELFDTVYRLLND